MRCSQSVPTKYGVMVCPEDADATYALASLLHDPKGEHPIAFPLCERHLALVTALDAVKNP
jgi:hypothetical protein